MSDLRSSDLPRSGNSFWHRSHRSTSWHRDRSLRVLAGTPDPRAGRGTHGVPGSQAEYSALVRSQETHESHVVVVFSELCAWIGQDDGHAKPIGSLCQKGSRLPSVQRDGMLGQQAFGSEL